MSCLRTTQLTDSELLMALDGEADREVTMHIADCPDCRVRTGQLQKFQNGLTNRLFRATCPPSIELGEYHLACFLPHRPWPSRSTWRSALFVPMSGQCWLASGRGRPDHKNRSASASQKGHAVPRCTIDDRLLGRTVWPA